ncbi:MAG: response regulator transcription factor [Chloroflexota bacterium]
MTISILLADDHLILRQGLRPLLEAEADFHVVAETGDGREALLLTEKLRPDVLILDLQLPGLNGLEVARQVSQWRLPTRIVVLSMYTTEEYVAQALRSGALAYVLKGSGTSELIEAIRHVVQGKRYLSQPFIDEHIDAYMLKTLSSEGLDPYETLTNRERQTFQLVAEGQSTTQIADRMGISPRTVEIHRAKVYKKLGLKGAAELIHYAAQRGIIFVEKPANANENT